MLVEAMVLPRTLAIAALLFGGSCSSQELPVRKQAGEKCMTTSECDTRLMCVGGKCLDNACKTAADCHGTPSASCDVWECNARRCQPGCATELDAGLPDDDAAESEIDATEPQLD